MTRKLLLLLLPLFALTGCERIYDSEGDCAVYLKVRDDYNLLFADAQEHDIRSLTVCAYDTLGRLRATLTSSDFRRDDYRIDISQLSGQRLTLIAWANTPGNPHYTLADIGDTAQHYCQLNIKDGDDLQQDGALFYGRLDDIVVPTEGTVVVPLVRNTNSVRVLLQEVTAEPLNPADYRITITDANTVMDAHNTPSLDALYTPHRQEHASARVSRADTINALVAEFSVGRLMTSHEAELSIYNIPEQKEIIHIPLTDYMLMVRGHYRHDDGTEVGPQEYLDRQSDYDLTLFLQDGNQWLASVIYINSWRIVREDVEM